MRKYNIAGGTRKLVRERRVGRSGESKMDTTF